MLKLQRLTVGVLLLAMLASQPACDKDSMVKWSERSVRALNNALPLIESAGGNTLRIRKAIAIADQLVLALKASDNAKALEMVSSLISAFEGVIISDVLRISDPKIRTFILAGLAIVDHALHEIADELAEQAPKMAPGMRGAPAMVKVMGYRQRKRWACRNSATGKFEKMEFCKQNPAQSTVDTFFR